MFYANTAMEPSSQSRKGTCFSLILNLQFVRSWSLIFQDPSLEDPDLGATMGTELLRTTRVLFAARVSYTRI